MKKFVDDGRTIYNMDNVGTPGQMKTARGTDDEKKERVSLNHKEKWCAIRAAFEVYAPIFLLVIACFSFVALMMYLWLK